ncbi:MAG: cyclase family protein [Halobacteriota archaeon]
MIGQDLLSVKTRVIDLSQIISVDTPVYPGDPVPRIELLSTVELAGARTTLLALGTHTGTHVDTPSHILSEERTIDELPLEAFYGRAWVFDVTRTAQESPVQSDDLDTGSPLGKGDIALIYTGASGREASKAPQVHSYLDDSAAEWLVKKRVKAVGVDSLSVDRYDSKTYDVHRKLLSNNIVIFENLSGNLKLLVGKRVLFFGLPLRLKAAEASPVRAFALY